MKKAIVLGNTTLNQREEGENITDIINSVNNYYYQY